MRRIINIKLAATVIIINSLTCITFADVSMPQIFSNNMVLQRDISINVWGWADKNEKVTVTLGDKQAETSADSQGNWSVKLPPFKVGDPLKMTIKGNNEIVFENVLIGEVWICSGQSNMQFGLANAFNAEEEIKNANYPNIRLYTVPQRTSGTARQDFDSRWVVCTPENISNRWGSFSAVAYFFGREIHQKINVPIGLINTSWGGSYIEAWIPENGFYFSPQIKDLAKFTKDTNKKYRKKLKENLSHADKKTGFGTPFVMPQHPFDIAGGMYPQNPTCLYNSMINPMVKYGIAGVIWYQGESNRQDGMLYYEKKKALIGSWRSIWQQGDFPFYYVQIAPLALGQHYKDDELPKLWEAQTETLKIKNTGMAVTVDIVDNVWDIHPINKQDVGKRLALWALAKNYGQKDIVYSGPLYKKMEIKDGRIIIFFDYADSGLTTRDGKEPDYFEIAAEDKKFVKAQTIIQGQTLVVYSEEVKNPTAVRFAWNQQATPNLCNMEKLPASPFRTDRW